MKRVLAFLLLFLALPGASWSLTVDEAVRMALERNPLVKEAAYRLEAQRNRERSVFTKRLPRITFDYRYAHLKEEPYAVFHYSDELKLPSLPNMPPLTVPNKVKLGEHQDVKWGIQATMPVFTGFYLESLQRIEKLGVKVTGFEEEAVRVNVAFLVRKAYYDVLLSRRDVETARENVAQLKAHVKDARSYYKQGLVPYNDVLKAEVALLGAKQRLTYTEEELETNWVNLNLLMGVKGLAEPHELSFSLENGVDSGIPDVDHFYLQALLNHPEIEAVEGIVEESKLGVKLAKSQYYPQISVFSRYEQHGDNWLANNNEYTNRENFILGIRANLLVFDWFGRRDRVREAKANHLAAAAELQHLKDLVRLEVRRAYAAVMVAKENMRTAKAALKQAQEDLRITKLQYSKQLVKSSDVIDSENALITAKNNYNNAIYGYHLALAALARSCGFVEVARLYGGVEQ